MRAAFTSILTVHSVPALVCSIGVAVYSHFGPGKFPANWNTVFHCVLVYVVINIVLAIFSNIKEGDSFLVTHPKVVSRSLTTLPLLVSTSCCDNELVIWSVYAPAGAADLHH